MELKDFVEIISAVGTLVLSIVALVFSIYSYKRVSFKADFKRKQLDTVYQLIEVLQDTVLHFESVGKNSISNSASGTMCRFFRMNYSPEMYKSFTGTDVFLVLDDPDNELEFIKFSEHPYIPTEIADCIREFVGYKHYKPVDVTNYKSYTLLGSGVFMMGIPAYQITDNKVYSSFEEFCLQCIKLDKAIHKWLKQVGITEFNKKAIIE